MLDFTFYSSTKFIFGKDAECQAGKCAAELNAKKVLIHYGGGSAVRSGLIARVEASLAEAGIKSVALGGVKPNPRSGLVYEGIRICREEKVDLIIAVGGGSVIDSAKAIAFGTLYEGDFWDYFRDDKHPEKALPLGVVLTIPAAGSEGSPDCVITLEEGMFKRAVSSDVLRSKFSLLNPELTFTLPPYQTACGCVDIMAHVMERYFTNEKGVELTDRLCEAVLKTMISQAPKVLKNPTDYDARANVMWAGMVAHNNICGVGREPDWGSHNTEHELSALYDVAHGAGLSVIFPAWMKYVYKHNIERFRQFAVRVWNCEENFEDPEQTVLEAIAKLEAFWKSLGMPIRMQEIGGKHEDFEFMAKHTIAGDGVSHLGNFVPLYEKDIYNIYCLSESD